MCLGRDEVEELDDQQREVNELSFDQTWIVYGPAGTGKTILALNRLQRLVELYEDETHVFISKSKMLGRWVEQAAEAIGVGNHINTFDQFVWNKVREYLGDEPDKTEPSARWSEIDWDKTLPRLRNAFNEKPDLEKFSLVLDEAQDVRPGFFEACKIMCSRIFILMDENQKTSTFANTDRSTIATILGVDSEHQKLLTINYRNPKEIKQLSETFYLGDPNELAAHPEDPKKLRRLEAQPAIRYLPLVADGQKESQVQRVLDYCLERPQATVCVAVPSSEANNYEKSVLALIRQELENYEELEARDDWFTRAYIAKAFERCRTDLCSPGIVIGSAINLKGSEFDAVYLINWDVSNEPSPSMYTLICRARSRLEVLATDSDASRTSLRQLFKVAIGRGLIKEAN